MARRRLLICLAGLALLALAIPASEALAHPADELCGPGSELDPELCRALSELDRPETAAGSDRIREELIVENVDRSTIETLALYARIGFDHILPKGADHILFVLAIFLSTTRLRPLLWQISAFTLAHTVTLGLASAGLLSPSPDIIEPLIAATIAFVACENLIFRDMARWRPIIVFGFGLLHGMGFAGAFGELGLPPGLFWTALAGFNIGVEIGQLAVIAIAFLARYAVVSALGGDGRAFGQYRRHVSWPLSAMIGAVGLYWTIMRIATIAS